MRTRIVSVLLIAVLVTTGTIGAVAGAGSSTTASSSTSPSLAANAASTQDGNVSAYSGTHVAFDASSSALTNYRVGDVQLFDRVAVESRDSHQAGADVGVDVSLEAVTNLEGVGLSAVSYTETRATIETEGSVSVVAHDTDRGILVVDAGGEGQYVEAALSSGTVASADGDRVIVERASDDDNESDGDANESEPRTGVFIVVGDGTISVNDDGNVAAELEGDSKLVFRSYADGERDEDAREQEDLIANGTATAEVYAEQRGEEIVTDVATYGEDIAVEATEQSRERVELTVERAGHEGTVVIASVSDAVLEAAERAEGLSVTVDGEAAVEASSYSELEGAIGSDESRYMVVQRGEAAATADVLVAVNHFSERTVAIGSADAGDAGDDDADDGEGSEDGSEDGEDDSTDGEDDGADDLPGFGISAALVSLLLGAVARLRG